MNNKEIFAKVSLLYVEDEEEAKIGMKMIFGKKFKKLEIADDGLDGLNKYKAYMYDVVVTDIKMPNLDGIDMVKKIKEINPNVKIIYTSAHSDSNILMKAIDAGADDYILKPINKTTLLFSISKVANEIIRDRKIKRYSKFVRLILDSQDNLVLVTDGEKVVDCNQATLDFLQKDSVEACDICICDYFIQDEGYLQKENWLNRLLDKEYTKVKMYDKLKSEDRVYIVKITPFIFESEEIEYVVTFTDITKLEHQREKLSLMATTDQLTSLANRNKFKIILEKEIEKYRREKVSFALIFFDIDHFKSINDTYGHNQGDRVLKELSSLVSNNIRSSDTVARWGGEEFILLCSNSSMSSAKLTAEKLRHLIETYDFGLSDSGVTCSFGVTEFAYDDNEEVFIKRADDALYEAKNSGRNIVKSK
jgi:diguanylate cyclase (GGDEF)-like protein